MEAHSTVTIAFDRIPIGMFSLIHEGSYNKLHEAWSRIGAYAEEKEYVPNGLHREVYLNDPNIVSEEELLTELQIPFDTAAQKTGCTKRTESITDIFCTCSRYQGRTFLF